MRHLAMDRSGEIEIFVRVVDLGGFSAAARSLNMAPSAVSKAIARLEARLGVRLLARTTRVLTLTQEGETYLRAGRDVLAALDAADDAVSRGLVRGHVSINASVPFGTRYVLPTIPDFMRKFPELTLDISLNDDVINLLTHRADIAFRVGALPDSGLMARKLGAARRVVCAAPTYLAHHGIPAHPHDLLDHDCLGFTFRPRSIGWPFIEKDRAFSVQVGGRIRVNNGESLRFMALAGQGIARLGHWHVADDIAQGTLVTLLEAYNPGDLEEIHALHGAGIVPDRVRAFIEHMVGAMRNDAHFR